MKEILNNFIRNIEENKRFIGAKVKGTGSSSVIEMMEVSAIKYLIREMELVVHQAVNNNRTTPLTETVLDKNISVHINAVTGSIIYYYYGTKVVEFESPVFSQIHDSFTLSMNIRYYNPSTE